MVLELKAGDLLGGDVLLCFSSMMANEAQADGTGYSHTAIVLPDQLVLEASAAGVRMVSVATLLDEYDHIAVLRNRELWDCSRLQRLEQFALEAAGKTFNALGLKKFPERKERRQADLMDRVAGFFEGTEPEVVSRRGVYFCSELTTAAFIDVGMIEQSAAVVFTPETFSPSDIGKDKVFGFFCGYLKSHPGYKIPEDDYFKDSL